MRIGWSPVRKYKKGEPWVLVRKDWKGEPTCLKLPTGDIARWKTKEAAAKRALELNIEEAVS